MKIVLEHLTKQFPPRGRRAQEPVTAVSDFNFEVPDGQLIGLLGPSGCGKSTTLNYDLRPGETNQRQNFFRR